MQAYTNRDGELHLEAVDEGECVRLVEPGGFDAVRVRPPVVLVLTADFENIGEMLGEETTSRRTAHRVHKVINTVETRDRKTAHLSSGVVVLESGAYKRKARQKLAEWQKTRQCLHSKPICTQPNLDNQPSMPIRRNKQSSSPCHYRTVDVERDGHAVVVDGTTVEGEQAHQQQRVPAAERHRCDLACHMGTRAKFRRIRKPDWKDDRQLSETRKEY